MDTLYAMGKEFFHKTMETGIDIFFHKPAPFYKKIGIDRLVKTTEPFLGPLSDDSRAEVGTCYLGGSIFLGLGIATGEPIYYVTSGSLYSSGLLHHRAMNKKETKKSKFQE